MATNGSVLQFFKGIGSMKEIRLEDNPDVSIIVPVHNAASLIPPTLNGLVNQSYKNFEVIIVDDGSTDNSKRIMEHFSFDRRFRFVSQPHAGLGAALNTGHKDIRGKYITWCDPGTIYYPMFVEVLRSILIQLEVKNKNSLGFAYSDFEFLDGNGNPTQKVIHKGCDTKKTLMEKYDIGVSIMYTKALWDKVGSYWSRPCENYQWCVRAALYTDFDLVTAVLAGFLPRPGLTSPEHKEAADDCLALARNLYEEVEVA